MCLQVTTNNNTFTVLAIIQLLLVNVFFFKMVVHHNAINLNYFIWLYMVISFIPSPNGEVFLNTRILRNLYQYL